MKKMSFTKSNSARQTSLLGTTFLMFFIWCFSITAAQAQTVVKMPSDSMGVEHKIESCDTANSFEFRDDDSGDSVLYSDADTKGGTTAQGPRADTVSFCPEDQWHRVEVVFTEFSIAADDSLRAFDGNLDSLRAGSAPYIASATGEGVSSAFGGWINANCDPATNPSGCLSFVFNTTNDNIKSAGWEAWVNCADRGVALTPAADQWASASCDGTAATEDAPTAMVTLTATTILGACKDTLVANGTDEIIVSVKSTTGAVCTEETVAAGANLAAKEYGVGSYIIIQTLKSDPAKADTSLLNVAGPALTCNDEVNVSLGGGCKIIVDLDNLLEGAFCDTNAAVSYSVVIKNTAGTTIATSTDKYGNTVVEKDKITDVCGGDQLTATITRTFDYSKQVTALMCSPGTVTEECSVKINVKDDTAPIFTRSAKIDTLVACDESQIESLLAEPDVIDNCGLKATVSKIEAQTSATCVYPKVFHVTWTAEDNCGKKASLTDTVRIIRPTIFADAPKVEKDCADLGNGIDPIVSQEGYRPGVEIGVYKNGAITADSKDTLRLSEEDYICNYILTKKHVEVPADCGKKYFVTWSVVDWCAPAAPSVINTQFIHFTDNEAPVIDASGIVSYEAAKANPESLPHFKCYLDKNPLPSVDADDNCDDAPTVEMVAVEQKGAGDTWTNIADNMGAAISGELLVCDTFRVIYEASDECHTQTEVDRDTSYLVIIDDTKPSAVAVDELNVSLPNAWGARICIDDIDAGSYDACGIKERGIKIKGKDAEYGECVDIGCEYVHTDLQIELRVIDEKGNENTAWTQISVEDKVAPVCYDLDEDTRKCTEFHNGELGASTDANGDRKFDDTEWTDLTADLQATYEKYFGTFQCKDNLDGPQCGELTTIAQQYQLIEWPCGEIEIKRRHQVRDWSENKSNYGYQDIKVEYEANWSFTLPHDTQGTCTTAPAEAGISIDNGACDLLGYEVTEKRFEVPGDACYKIERTYHIINWCKYTAGQNPLKIDREENEHGVVSAGQTITSAGHENEGYWTYVQILKVHDDEAPVVTVVDPTPCINGVDFDAEPYGEEDNSFGEAPYECDEEKTWTATATDCSDQSAITWIARLRDANGNVVRETQTNSISIVVTNKSTYTAEFWAYDGCGNSGGASGETLEFWDCKKPTPYLLNGIAVELGEALDADGQPTGKIQVWASDLDQGSFDNCTDQDKLELRIQHEEDDVPTTTEDVLLLGKVVDFGCNKLGQQNVRIYAIDEEGNWDYAQTYVIVQDNMGACGDAIPNAGGMVAGRIVDGNGENVASVSVAVNGADEKDMTTTANGNYQFVLPMGGDYTVTPAKDMNPLNGVSTFDLVLISKHILGITAFDTPYKYIAADVNKSGTITAFDMVQLRQLILNINSEFPNNDSWRFVEGGYTFTSANPAAESFNEFMSINNLSADMPNMDFIAVKVGDVNGSALANNLLGAESRTANGTLNLNVADRFVEAGQTVTVEFTSADIASATGYQFTLTTAGTAEVVEGVAKAANFNTNLAERGVIATSWNGEATASDVLFALNFTANTAGLLSDMVAVTSDVTAAEAYNTDGELLNVGINFSAATTAGFELNQNTPNPFNAETVIGFNLPTAGAATLKVLDVQGKVLKAITADYAKGYNTVSLNANELGATGVLYYQLESADNVATKKMIIID